jgi:hypothetical protein
VGPENSSAAYIIYKTEQGSCTLQSSVPQGFRILSYKITSAKGHFMLQINAFKQEVWSSRDGVSVDTSGLDVRSCILVNRYWRFGEICWCI